ncbi:MAG: polysaccharide export protein [Deferribacteres bacterium]|nr:polysaccharide export protein [Deferribacteres bacterium]
MVRPDGKISFPLAGDVPAVCLTFEMLREELVERLKQYVRDPIISISLKKTGDKKVIVLGEVNEPGVYYVSGQRTVLEAIARANGFTQHAVLSSVILLRGGPEHPEGIRLDLNSAINKTDMTQNVALRSEDMVYVPRKFIADVNYFVTQFLEPIYKSAWTLRLMQVISQ